MSFTIKGTFGNRTVEITWEDGKLTGPPEVVQIIKADAKVLEREDVGPVGGPFTRTKHLSNPLSASIIIREVLDEVLESSGNVPSPPEVPERAIV